MIEQLVNYAGLMAETAVTLCRMKAYHMADNGFDRDDIEGGSIVSWVNRLETTGRDDGFGFALLDGLRELRRIKGDGFAELPEYGSVDTRELRTTVDEISDAVEWRQAKRKARYGKRFDTTLPATGRFPVDCGDRCGWFCGEPGEPASAFVMVD